MKLRISLTFCCLAVVMFTGDPTPAQSQTIEDGLAGHWTFDEKDIDGQTAKDALGEHDGEIMGQPQIVEGKVGEALRFNGQDDYVVMGAVTEGQNLTYAMWIKVDQLPAGPKVIIWDDNANGGGDSWLELLADGTIQTQRGGDGFGSLSLQPPSYRTNGRISRLWLMNRTTKGSYTSMANRTQRPRDRLPHEPT